MYGADAGRSIDDYSFAYIDLLRSDFKNEKKFEDYCEFLKEDKDSETVRVPIDIFAAKMINGSIPEAYIVNMICECYGIGRLEQIRDKINSMFEMRKE